MDAQQRFMRWAVLVIDPINKFSDLGSVKRLDHIWVGSSEPKHIMTGVAECPCEYNMIYPGHFK